jgi:hypothetical protein
MPLRRLAPATLVALAISACTSTVPSNPNTAVVTAEFDPTAGVLPLPNTLATNPLLNPGLLAPQNAQDELLAYFNAQGGFPADQLLPLDFPVAILNVNGPNDVTRTAPAIDLATVVPCTGQQAPGNCNLFVYDATGATGAQFPSYVTTYTAGDAGGTLRVTPVSGGHATTWRPGAQIFYALRGGANGIKTTSGEPLQPSSTSYLLIFGGPSDFACPSTHPDCALKTLQLLQTQYQPVFAAVANSGFPLSDTVVVGSFGVTPRATTWVTADAGSGVVPVPSDFMLDPVTNRVSAAAATAFGVPALASLDGFSTTGMDVAQTTSWSDAERRSVSSPVRAATIRSAADQGVYLYRLGASGATEVPSFFTRPPPFPAQMVFTQPPPITIDPSTGLSCVPDGSGDYTPACLSSLIGIQPAVTVPVPGSPVPLPPLAEKTEYAVIVTKKVQDATGRAISNTTLGQILLFTHPICTPSPACVTNPTAAVSEIAGVSGPQAALLEGMRLRLKPAVAQVRADHAVEVTDIALPYTFRTQSITGDAVQLGAGPYARLPNGAEAFPDAPVGATAVTPATMAAKWGVPASLLAAGISTFVEANVLTFDKLDPATGAFNPTPTAGTLTPIPAIVALPQGTPPAGGWPLVVFHHGLGRSRGDVLLIAQALTSGGMAVAAIDSAKHGARSWCSANTLDPTAPTGCAAGVTCDTSVFAQQQGDAPTARPGLCRNNGLQLAPIGPAPFDPALGGGNAVSSGAFVVTANLFRSRDTIRQDILDQSMLVRVLTTANGNAAIAAAAGLPAGSVALSAAKVHYVGQSWGSILGTNNLAAIPRFSRGMLSVGGATLIDILTTAPDFADLFQGLAASLGLTPGTPEYLLFLIGAKWILDPADPANFAGHVTADPLPDLLADPTGATPQAAKTVLAQAARCDATVPNGTNELLYGLMGLGPTEPTVAGNGGLQWYMSATDGTCPADGSVGPGVAHGFLLDWARQTLASTAQTQTVTFLLGGAVQASPVVIPTSAP